MTVKDDVQHIAQQILTPGQYLAWTRETHGHSQRLIALELGISRSSVIDRLDNAHRKLHAAGVRMDASGNYYLEESA